MNIRDIERVLPHRYPFLLVDRVQHIDDERIVAVKMVTRNEPHFEGHFPGHPVMPGVLIIEALAQAGALYAARLTKFDPEKQVIFFMTIDKAKFRKPVIPGDQIRCEVEMIQFRGKTCRMKGMAYVDGHLVCEAEMMAAVVDR